ncbi:MAG: HepT-like ribonuclease domain-containing protein [Candidatus Nanopelagicales bacterium]
MDRKTAKELLHLRDWLDRTQEIVDRGKDAYLREDLLQEAGDSLMMKLGEASNRLSRVGFQSPSGVLRQDAIANRNWLIHQYDEIDREITWTTLTRDFPRWRQALNHVFESAEGFLGLPARPGR